MSSNLCGENTKVFAKLGRVEPPLSKRYDPFCTTFTLTSKEEENFY